MKSPKRKIAQHLKENQVQLQGSHRSIHKDLLWFSLVVTFFKVLLIPAYHSTDFEVHRNWLALTHTLPLSQWYTDETSPWTLDYPPFFAYFERFLSFFASLVDPTITDLHNGLNYKALSVIIFQRLSVIASDTILIYSVYNLTRNLESKKRFLILMLVIWSPGLLIVDHVHFQYNGFLLGILLISLGELQKGNDLIGGFFFAVLLCFKHLFAVAGPIYFVYLLRHYCRGGIFKGFNKLVAMGVVVVGVFVAAYGPFAYHEQIQEVLRRMFPFGRGLCHAYWAPNFWVFYILSDKLLALVLAKLGFRIQTPTASFTSGLVGDTSPFAILPKITPSVTLVMVLLAISPILVKAWRNPQPKMIVRWVAYAYSCGFLFGWHVHEKASLHFLIPLAVVAVESVEDACHFLILSTVSVYSLFPLLYEAQEYPIKVILLLLHITLMWFGFSSQFSDTSELDKRATRLSKIGDPLVIGLIEKSYLLGFVVVEAWVQFLHPLLLGDRLPFLPLMLISFYCALGMMYSWIWQLRYLVTSH
uniref:probable dolichyl pyrophosphate Glc1Man9GlcNAc2 alpha-1,3-glucosyltransferase n=1 Tax=Erigeron canadensis TaxID=72917 RepID=UPI001CB8C1D9|nr:probable dolichyl pyrophosphate Glc1Man9GlcNAc2 alpha-1,3-glucosyltransferase [Erigeron canadensis]